MISFRLFYVVPFLLLAACAPKTPVLDTPNNLEPSLGTTDLKNQTSSKVTADSSVTVNEPLLNEQNKTNNRIVSTKIDTKLSKANTAFVVNNPENSAAAKISSWNLSGAMAARSQGKGYSASVNWIQRGAGSYQIRMSGPLGSGTILISKSGGLVTLKDGPKTASSSNAESLLKQQTGISLPVTNLYYWVRGIPAPGAAQGKKYDQAGHLLGLRQAGFTIEYQQYRAVGNAVLPSSIRLQGNGVFIKLIIKDWQI
ncbi:MAG: outer membrane lipoprotein LolB [Tatlockia sp.]|nr:outer membrane lipoprotein LolB [Tatlockia sp.]